MSLAQRLASSGHDAPPIMRPREPKGYEQGVKYDGGQPREVTLNLAQIPEDEAKWRDEIARVTGLTIPDDRAVQLAQVRYWGGPASPMVYCRFTITDRSLGTEADLDALVKAAKRNVNTKNATAQSAGAFVVALGDLQIGKMDGDGFEGTAQRFIDGIKASVREFKRHKSSHVILAHLGDCIEGFVSKGGSNSWRTPMTTTEQVRAYRRLVFEQVKAFAPIAERITLAGVPGNHDEAHRPLHTYGDSWATEALIQVADAFALAGNYEHLTVLVPERDELTLTVDAGGTIIALAHGHQWRNGQGPDWWSKQAHGRQPVGEADLLLSGHLHHLRIQHTGSDKTWLQLPALESGSTWWKHKTGEWGQPGIVTFTAADGRWDNLRVLS